MDASVLLAHAAWFCFRFWEYIGTQNGRVMHMSDLINSLFNVVYLVLAIAFVKALIKLLDVIEKK